LEKQNLNIWKGETELHPRRDCGTKPGSSVKRKRITQWLWQFSLLKNTNIAALQFL